MTIPFEALKAVKTLVTHANCADGLASAMIIQDAFGYKLEVKFLAYQMPESRDLKAEPNMLFCDYTPERERVQEFVDAGAIELDHHIEAKDIVDAFGERGVFAHETHNPGVSGAVLAYEHVWRPMAAYWRSTGMQGYGFYSNAHEAKVSRFAYLAGVRDTWQRSDPDWMNARRQTEALHFYPREEWLAQCPTDKSAFGRAFDERMKAGPILVKKFDDRVKGSLREAFWFDAMGKRFVIISGVATTSDVSDQVGDKADAIIGYTYRIEEPYVHGKEGAIPPTLQLSLRSRGTFPCGKFAVTHGGNGHSKSAGCKVRVDLHSLNPYMAIRGLIESFLEGESKLDSADQPLGV